MSPRVLTCVALASVSLIFAGPAHADPPNGCPGGMYLFAVVPGLEFDDTNGDGYICGKDLPRNPFGGLVFDNKPKTKA